MSTTKQITRSAPAIPDPTVPYETLADLKHDTDSTPFKYSSAFAAAVRAKAALGFKQDPTAAELRQAGGALRDAGIVPERPKVYRK